MNCKPGDLAIAFRPGPFQNKLFFIIEAAPVGFEFRLPDGFLHASVGAGFWVVESAGSMLSAKTDRGHRRARFGVGDDAGLRPIRDPGEDATDEMVALLGKPASQPSKVTV